MRKPWMLPLVILILLFLAAAFRWDHLESKSRETSVIKWKIDQWAGQGWIEIYSTNGIREKPIYPGTTKVTQAWSKRNSLGNWWYIGIGCSSLWLASTLVLRKKESPRETGASGIR